MQDRGQMMSGKPPADRGSGGFSATRVSRSGLETVVLSGGPEGLTASFAPRANMVLYSLSCAGEELLEARDGVRAYAERGTTMGVPLLYPWANRLSGLGYRAGGVDVEFDVHSPLLKLDANGLPIHGAIPGFLHWRLTELASDSQAAWLEAQLVWDVNSTVSELFPFPHELTYRASLSADSVCIEIGLTPTSDRTVPVAFGFHPYFRLRTGQRAAAQISLPVRERLILDEQMIPTGESEAFTPGPRRLGADSWDDGFTALDADPFTMAARTREISIDFRSGYSYAQVFAPAQSDFLCVEPMTAPTNALVSGRGLTLVAPGHSYSASFVIEVGSEELRGVDAARLASG